MPVLLTVIFFGLLLFSPSSAYPEIIVHDLITIKGGKTTLRVETRGKFLRRGGELVDISVNDKSIGRALSGGDGFAFRQFTATVTGIYRITATSGTEEGAGLLLSLRKGEKIIFIDAEGALLKGPFAAKPKERSQETIKKLSARFPVVYLQTGILGVKAIKKWLNENGFHEAPVIQWRQGMIFEEIKDMGLGMKAVIGSSKVVASAKTYDAETYSFEDGGDHEEVKEWQEIGEKVK
jgi:hypothetical protein